MRVLGLFAILIVIGLFIPAWAQNVPKTSTYAEAVDTAKLCKKSVDEDSSMTEAEKIVAKRNCSIDSTKKIVGDIERKNTRLNELKIKNLIQCETWFDNYKNTVETVFKSQKPQQLADDCIKLYNDEMWTYSGADRIEKLLERADQLMLFKIAAIKASLPEKGLPPLKQTEAGIPKTHVDCKDGFVLMFKVSNKMPACVSLDSADRFISRGWGTLKL